jgi:hypothetical protein
MKKLVIFLFLSGCSVFNKGPQLSDSANQVPGWVYSPYESCTENEELCATGESKSFAEADAQARINLASIFQVQVTSNLSVSSSSAQSFSWQAEVKEEVQRELKESVDQILETVQIRKRFKKDGLSYSLASLDRSKVSELLGARMAKLDYGLDLLWKRRQRTSLRKMIRLSLERDKLNERYSIVSGVAKPSLVTHEQILAWASSRPDNKAILLKSSKAPDWMGEKLKELLTEAGFRIVKEEAPQILSLNIDSIKEFLNVSGFEKYTFTLSLIHIENGEKKKVLSLSETVTGRTQSDALLKVKNSFIDYLEQHLSDLDLD